MKVTTLQKLVMNKTKFGYLNRIMLDPYWVASVILRRFLSKYIKNDETFIKWEFFCGMHKFPNLKNPQTYNEKLQWMKLNDRNFDYIRMVDKATAKDYVKEKLGTDENIIPTFGVWDKFEDIDFDSLSNQFVLKTTHDSGGVVICKDKSKLDIRAAKVKLSASLSHDYYMEYREWPYKNIPRRIIAEQFMVDESGTELKDYKFFCFDGEIKFLKVDFDRFIEHHANYYSPQWKLLPFGEAIYPPRPEHKIEKPVNLDEMLKIARTLSNGIPFVRIDLYNINGHIYFGEMTFFPASGMGKFEPDEWDKKIGELWTLPNVQ